MFAISVKSVPGCWVLIVPRLIGVPVAATPGLLPHDEVSLAPPPPLVEADVAGAPEDVAGAPAEDLLELELHPASTPQTDRTEASAAASRHLLGAYSFIIACLHVSTATNDSERHRAALESKARSPRGMHADRSFTGKRCLIALPFDCLSWSM